MSHISADLVTHFCSGQLMGIKVALFRLAGDCCEMSDTNEDTSVVLNPVEKSACCQDQHQILSLDQHTCFSEIATDVTIKWQALSAPIIPIKCLYGFYDSTYLSYIFLRRLLPICDFQSFLQVFLI